MAKKDALGYLSMGDARDKLDLAISRLDRPTPCAKEPLRWDADPEVGTYVPTPEEAEQMCAGCPVLKLCRTFALDQYERGTPMTGVVGGILWVDGEPQSR